MTAVPVKWLFMFLLIIAKYNVLSFRCDRRPYGTTTQSSPADGRFKLQIVGTHIAYLPDQLYIVQITETDGMSRFTGFMISAEGDLKPDPRNPRRMITQYPGEIRPQSSNTAKFSDRCLYSVEHTVASSKSSVEVYWQAPPSGSGCVTLRAMVAESSNIWFEDGSPLTLRVCEDTRQPDDLSLQSNYNCQVCDEAKYEISFTGIWSRNTHPRYYPENDWVPRYSDLVGASHTADFILWSPGTAATDGLRQLAEHANSSKLEEEILGKVGDGVRTLIKGKGHSDLKMNIPTYAFFRSDKNNHMISVAVGIYPSPDWFLGVARFELCQEDNTWLQERELNLFPWDAGTDSGVSYESANIETFPQDAITRVQTSSYDKNSPFYEMDMKDLHPFGRLGIKLVKTYHRDCEGATDEGEGNEESTGEEEKPEEENGESNGSEPEEPSRYQNPDLDSSENGGSEIVPSVDPGSDEDCPMTPWQEWSKCEGICENNKIKGLKWRVRDHVPPHPHGDVPKFCKNRFETFENVECEEECSEDEENDITAEKRIMVPVVPGQSWSKKRELNKVVQNI
ncbi:hypothetical protein ABMA27_002269 [Loxostege sticticalis]|uniref:Spondin-1 n=1 Tax=Loxostege sticticalis TaxID=481309 RepID=A0ABR3HX72_LOXSC